MRRLISIITVALAVTFAGTNLQAQEGFGLQAQDEGTGKRWEGRVFLSVNGGYQTLNPDFNYVDTATMFLEEANAQVSYPEASGFGLDIGGGVRLVGNFGVGVTYTRYDRSDSATLTLELPHPIFFDEPGVGTLSVPLERKESTIHIQAIYMIPILRQLQVGVFGGPSYFKCEQGLVENFYFDWSLNPDLSLNVELMDPETINDVDELWGYNVGTDVNFLFNKHIGFGGQVRYSDASHDAENPLQAGRTGQSSDPFPMEHGGLQFGLGLRLRF
jgi:hypothetical protein